MKTLTILFESPNVFKLIENWSYFKEHKCGIDFVKNHNLLGTCDCYKNHLKEREQSKSNSIRIDNPEILAGAKGPLPIGFIERTQKWTYLDQRTYEVQNGDIFQVEGFEYELETRFTDGWMPTYNNPDNSGCDIPAEPYQVAILKLAKEEEPKEKLYTIDEVIHKLRLGLSEYGKKNGIAGYWVLEDNVYYILNKLKK